jgi:hypothetical protein
LPNPETVLFLQATAVVGFSVFFFRTITLRTLLGASLILLPVIVSLLAQEKLVLKTKRPRPTESGRFA